MASLIQQVEAVAMSAFDTLVAFRSHDLDAEDQESEGGLIRSESPVVQYTGYRVPCSGILC